MAYFSMTTTCEDGAVNVNHWEDHDVAMAPACARTDNLEGKKGVAPQHAGIEHPIAQSAFLCAYSSGRFGTSDIVCVIVA